MRFDTLEAWLAWQESLNPRGIELGLDRVRRVLERLDLIAPPYRVITVGGTNGKGSVASYAASILRAAGFCTGRYLSPHLLRYNERIAVDDIDVSDEALCAVFETVDDARRDESLTYFEFGTLAALELFRRRNVDVAVLEVGLGGRLDAVNVIDADVSVVVSVGIDHVDWLGAEIDGIAREKAGIFRAGRPAIFGSRTLPSRIVSEAERIGATLAAFGRDFMAVTAGNEWVWRQGDVLLEHLPALPLPGEHQIANAATAIAAVRALEPALDVDAVRCGLAATKLPGRLQSLGGDPEVMIDVGHNPDAAAQIAAFMRTRPKPTHAVLGMLADKDAAGFVRELAPLVEHWHFASLAGSRGQDADALAEQLALAGWNLPHDTHPDVATAARAALACTAAGGRVLVLGSFHTVGEFLVYFDAQQSGRSVS